MNTEGNVYEVGGRLDTMTAPELLRKFNDSKPAEHITLDARNLDYISSAGLRVLLSAQKTMNKQGSMVVKNISQEIQDIFEVTGFDEILNIEK